MVTEKKDENAAKRKRQESILEEKSYEFEILRQQLMNTDKQLQELYPRMDSYSRVKETLEGLKEEGRNEVIIPLGEGVMIKTFPEKTGNILLEVGSGVVVGKKLTDAVEYVQQRIDEADNLIGKLNNNAQVMMNKMREMEPELLKLTQELRQE